MIAGNIGSKKRAKYGVVGHAVNVTSRIEDQTLAGEILVAKTTLDASMLKLALGRRIKLQPKGVTEIIDVSAVKSIKIVDINKPSQPDTVEIKS